MQLTDKQRKYAWIGAAVLGIIYFGPTLLNGVRQLTSSGKASAAVAKPSAARVALPLARYHHSDSISSCRSPGNAFTRHLAGAWRSSGAGLLHAIAAGQTRSDSTRHVSGLLDNLLLAVARDCRSQTHSGQSRARCGE